MLYLDNPAGHLAAGRRKMLDRLRELHQLRVRGDRAIPEIEARIAQYEMAFRMQTSVPEADRLSRRARSTSSTSTAPTCTKPGTFAANCLLARRLAERDVRFIQLYHPGWDQHGGLPGEIRVQCREIDRPARPWSLTSSSAGCSTTPWCIWGGEFGRTNYSPGQADCHRLRPRPPSAVLHRLAGRRRDQAGLDLRRDRRVRLQHHR